MRCAWLEQVAQVLAVFFLGLVSVTAAQSSARPSPVEVEVPKPPAAVMIEGQQTFIYELHITNFGPSALKLTEIQVYASARKASPGGQATTALAAFSGPALEKLLQPVGGLSQKGGPAQLDIGQRVIAFMYVRAAPGVNVPALRHRFLFDVSDPSRGKGTANDESALDGILVPVLQPPLVLAAPFHDGIWLAGNGSSNTSDHRRAVIAIDGRAFISQRFAIDWVMVGKNGNSFHDSRDRNENFWGFGQPVLAVADGEVTEVADEFPDNHPGKLPPVTVRNIAGNHIIMRIAPGVYVMFAHLKQGSISVRLHQRVKRGAQLAQLGNSGNTTGAHLHFQVMDADSPLAAEGLPFIFEKFRFLGLGKDFELSHHPDLPRGRALPADDSVIMFR